MPQRLKEFVKKVLSPGYFNIARRIYRRNYFAKDNLDKKMKKYLHYENGFFVELGANDGMVQSNTYYFEKTKGWRGVLIEPLSHKYKECKANRSSENAIYCAACVSFDFKEEFVQIAYSNYMSAPLNLETDIESPMDHAKKGEKYLMEHEEVFVLEAKAITLNELLSASSAPAVIDFLSLDVEGAEIEVLKGVDHLHFRFKYMLIECRDFEKLKEYLTLQDYVFVEQLTHHDYLFADNQNKRFVKPS